MKKMRIDVYLFKEWLARSRSHAANLVELNRVFLRGKVVTKASQEILEGEIPEVIADDFYSLGGCKLQKALEEFGVVLEGKTVLDAGCANGGFTGVLLSNGAARVFAVDVGENVLPSEINSDSRVTFLRKNVRYLTKNDFQEPIQFIVADLSFISLKLVIPVFRTLIRKGDGLILLIKPQFEVGPKALSKNGIVTDQKMRENAVKDISSFIKEVGFQDVRVTYAPHPFKEKNQEYLLYAVL